MNSYLETTKNVYKEAAENPQKGLCCTTTPVWQLPGLDIPTILLKAGWEEIRKYQNKNKRSATLSSADVT